MNRQSILESVENLEKQLEEQRNKPNMWCTSGNICILIKEIIRLRKLLND